MAGLIAFLDRRRRDDERAVAGQYEVGISGRMIDPNAFREALATAQMGGPPGSLPDLKALAAAISAAPIYAGGAQPTLPLEYMILFLRPEWLAPKVFNLAQRCGASEALRVLSAFLSAKSFGVRHSLYLRGIATPRSVELGEGWSLRPPDRRTHPQLTLVPNTEYPFLAEYGSILTYSRIVRFGSGWGIPMGPPENEAERDFLDAVRILSVTGPSGVSREALWTELDDPAFEALIQVGSSPRPFYDEIRFTGPSPPVADPAFLSLLLQFRGLPEKSRTRLGSAIDRLNLGFRRQTPGDKALDGSIALETALATADFRGEITFRLRLRTALLLGGTLDDRRNAWRIVGKLYALRSAVVHSGGIGPTGTTEEATAGLEVVARVIRTLIEIGDISDWSAVELSGGLARARHVAGT